LAGLTLGADGRTAATDYNKKYPYVTIKKFATAKSCQESSVIKIDISDSSILFNVIRQT
jgi:hypothetical protein